MDKLRILMVAGDMHVGGIENQLMHLARNADKDRYQIDFTSTRPDAFFREEIEQLGGQFILLPPMNWRKPNEYCRALLHVMESGQYDVVHSHELFHSGITLWLAYRAGIPCRFAHAHNWSDDDGTGRGTSLVRKIYNQTMRRMLNRYSTMQIACSTWAGKFVFGEKKQAASSYRLVFNSVDVRKFLDKYDQVESGEFCEDGWINILNVGRITPVKNQMFLVEIAEEIRRRGKKIRILCAGNGDDLYLRRVQSRIEEKNLQEYICLLGIRKDIDVLARKSKAFVLPSKYEGMPLVMIEAQAAGLPCVSATTYSPEVDFEIGTVTWLSLSDGISAWTDRLEQAVTRGRASKQEVEQVIREKRFASEMFAATLCDLYEKDYAMHKRETQ